MGLGQPEDKLTITIRYPTGKMRVHLHEVLARTGVKMRVDHPEDRNPYNGAAKPKYIMDYPIGDCRKLFKFIIMWCADNDLRSIDKFIKNNSERLYNEWVNQRVTVGR